MDEKTLESTRIFKGRIIGVRDDKVLLTDGTVAHREICEHPGAVAIVPLLGNDSIILIKQFRKPVEEEIFEIPAGLVNKGEDLKSAAIRELKEETGYDAESIDYLTTIYTSPGYSTENLHIFIAKCSTVSKQNTDEDEKIEVFKFSHNEVLSMIKDQRIKDGKTIAGVLMAMMFFQNKFPMSNFQCPISKQ